MATQSHCGPRRNASGCSLGLTNGAQWRHFSCFNNRATMGRRRKDDDGVKLVAQLVGVVLLLSLFSPGFRNILATISFSGIMLLVFSVVCLATFVIYRLATRSKRLQTAPGNHAARWAVSIPAAPTVQRMAAAPELSSPLVAQLSKPENLLDQLRRINWFQFEKIVALTYRRWGYQVTRRGGANADGGIDLPISKDGEMKAVQCKQWRTWNVGVKAVREFLGALTDAGIEKGAFITLRGYTGEAKQLADKHGITIINEVNLAAMLGETGARFDPEVLEILGDTRKFCPKCEQEMVLRTAQKGLGAGNHFWGCSAYPKCRFTMPVNGLDTSN